MTIENTSLQEEVAEVLSQGAKAVHYKWAAVIHTDAGDVNPLRVLSIDNVRNYTANYCDVIVVELSLGYGTYQQLIVPHATNLTITLQRIALQENSDQEDLTQDIEAQEWRATLLNRSSSSVEGNSTFGTDIDSGDLTAIVPVQFQLVDLAIEQTRMQQVGTILKKVKPLDAITYLMTKIAQGLDVDANHKIKGFQVVPANNTKVYDHMVIPQRTRAVDVAGYIEAHCGAPYTSGMGTYLQRGIWYIYPLFDLTRYDDAKKTVTVVNIPKNRLPTIDRSFRKSYNQLVILATMESQHKDPSESLQLDHGNGARYADADRKFDAFAEVANNKAVVYRAKNANEYIAEARPNGNNNVQTSAREVTTNTFYEMGRLAARMGSYITIGWENSDPGAIEPGTPCRYLYAVNDKVFELKGVILQAHHRTEPQQPGLADGPYRTNSALTLFVERSLDWADSNQVTS